MEKNPTENEVEDSSYSSSSSDCDSDSEDELRTKPVHCWFIQGGVLGEIPCNDTVPGQTSRQVLMTVICPLAFFEQFPNIKISPSLP